MQNPLFYFKRKTFPWFRSLWFNSSLLFMVFLSILIGLITEAPGQYLLGQLLLGLSVYFSLWLLADRPLLNPIQAVIPLFYWWFGVGPTMVAAFKALVDLPEDALYAQISGMESLPIVALGLPLYAIAARNVLDFLSKRTFGFKFLLPSGQNYKIKTLVTFFVCGYLAELVIIILGKIGITWKEEVSYLGGAITIEWWVGVIAGISGILTFGKSAILSYIVQSPRKMRKTITVLAIGIILISLFTAVTSGWKGAFVFIGIYILVAYISQKQRIPWVWIGVGLLAYFFVVEPFVTTGRYIAEKMNIQTTAERKNIYRTLIEEGNLIEKRSWKEIKIESPFRGIYQLAGEITRRNGLFDGEWRGHTIAWGLSALIPRALYPDKPMMNVGNYFALTIGVDIGMISPRDYLTNIGPSIPFEIIGNFGWLPGIFSFSIIGAFWALFCAWILSPLRLSNHPLTPLLVGVAFGMEAALGHFLAGLRNLIIPLAFTFVIWILLRQKL